ncbi:hypothetical protein F5B21DRAFT_509567 [Xylaria acuta]|nr:hypothetical protein F5B21DRAFT_509567 [Xylaria acuta]
MELQRQVAQSSLQTRFSVSHFCTLILDYWALILQQDTCVLTQPLGQQRNPVLANADPQFGNSEEDEHEDSENMEDIRDSSQPTDNHQASWDWTRFLLNEERASLCLWESSVSNEVLDCRTPDVDGPTGRSLKFLRDAILDSLARIGQALLKSTVLGSRGDESDATCRVRKELEVMVGIALQIVHKTIYGDYQLNERSSTIWTDFCGSERGSAIGDGEPDLFSVLKASISTLQSLSFL